METCSHGNVWTKELNKAGGHERKKKTFYWIQPSEDVTITDTSWWRNLHLPLIGCYICTYIRSRQTGLRLWLVLPVQTCPWILIGRRSGKRCTVMRESFMCFVVINRRELCVRVRVCVCACVRVLFLSRILLTPNPLHCGPRWAIRADGQLSQLSYAWL